MPGSPSSASTLNPESSAKAGKPVGVVVIQDFTGDREMVCWSESYLPARDAGLMEAGRVIQFKAQVTVDDRTEQRRLTGSQNRELKEKRVKRKTR